jgi:flagellar motility protein MotE (MotC chaperone)
LSRIFVLNIFQVLVICLQALKELSKLKEARQQLVEDQKVLQNLHDQLNAEYDMLSKEREMLKSNLKDARAEKRSQQEKYLKVKAVCSSLEADKENWEKDSESLLNLRTEHSKLKVRHSVACRNSKHRKCFVSIV